ncbi:signal peptidase I [Erysipelothrix anatis]|uniref:signal peptidase I n=1 Tax=Erysipelothrix anatis TaxID=2683713 RepID=UPI00135B0C37|nr:signal peptidase I [Erysipelothrix anatis]
MREKQDDKFLLLIKDFIKSLIISLIAVFIITQFIARPVRVEGLSMYPTLNDNEFGFSNVIGLKVSDIERFDVVVVHMEEKNRNIVKRVIGLPGEKIRYEKDVLYVNDVAVEEPFLDNPFKQKWVEDNDLVFTADEPEFIVPEGHYFVLGDNRRNSSDSRQYGAFAYEEIISKCVFVFLPLNKLRPVGR